MFMRSGEGAAPSPSPRTESNQVGEFRMINVGDFQMIIDTLRSACRPP